MHSVVENLPLVRRNEQSRPQFINTGSHASSVTSYAELHPDSEYSARFAAVIHHTIKDNLERAYEYVEEHSKICFQWLQELQANRMATTPRYSQIHWEYKIWHLIQYLRKAQEEKGQGALSHEDHFFNPRKTVSHQYQSNEINRRVDNVLLWLEEHCPQATYLTKGSISYKRTLSQHESHRHQKLQSMDPDVMTREHIQRQQLSKEELKDVDEEDELLYNVRRLIRRGKWDKAEELCRNYGQSWRVASLAGRRILTDNQIVDDKHSISGNSRYLLWLKTCHLLSEQSESLQEKWIYAACCGAPQALLNSCENWEDMLWSLFHCRKQKIVRDIFIAMANTPPGNWHSSREQRILTNNKNISPLLSKNILNRDMAKRLDSMDSIFDFIEQRLNLGDEPLQFESKDEFSDNVVDSRQGVGRHTSSLLQRGMNFAVSKFLKRDGKKSRVDSVKKLYVWQYYKLCRFLICSGGQGGIQNVIDALLEDAFSFINSAIRGTLSCDYVRFIIHLYLYLYPNVNSQLGTGAEPSATITQLVRIYIKELTRTKQFDLVGAYCLVLPNDDLIETYADFLQGLEDPNLRIQLLQEVNTNDVFTRAQVTEIAKRITDTVMDIPISDPEAWKRLRRPQKLDDHDQEKIEALMLCLCQDNQIEEALARSNQLFAQFAREYKDAGCSQLLARISEQNFEEQVENQLAVQPYIRCQFHTLESWELFTTVANWIETWEMNRQNEPMNAHSSDHEQWAEADRMNTISLLDSVSLMLQYPKGWLNPDYCAIKSWKWTEVQELRGIVLARVLVRVCNICKRTKNYAFCMEIAKYVADERYGLYSSMSKSDVKQLLYQVQNAQIHFLEDQQQRQAHMTDFM